MTKLEQEMQRPNGKALNHAPPERDGHGNRGRLSPWILWLQWVLAGAIGFGSYAASDEGPLWLAALCLVLALVAQWLVLRKRVARAGCWLIATPIGLTVGFFLTTVALFALAPSPDPETSEVVSAIICLSIPLGLAQLPALYQRIGRVAAWWVPATVVGFAAGLLVAGPCALGMGFGCPERNAVVVLALSGAIYGVITGTTLIFLLPKPTSAPGSNR
jgi:hypothetical protein